MSRERYLTLHLIEILGEDGFVAIAQAFGGTRIYVPQKLRRQSEVAAAIGRERAVALSAALGGTKIRVPLGRRERALAAQREGLSTPQIALLLGMTSGGVAKLLVRGARSGSDAADHDQPAGGRRQLTLF